MNATKQRKPRRLSLRAALKDAAAMIEREQLEILAESLSGIEVPEDWAPFAGDELPTLPGGDAGDDDEEQEQPEPQYEEGKDEEEKGGEDDENEDSAEEQQDNNGASFERDQPSPFFSHWVRSTDNGLPLYVRQFSSVRDFCEQPFAHPENENLFMYEENEGKFHDYGEGNPEARGVARTHGNMGWYGARSPREAMDRAFRGWPEGADKVREMMAGVDAPPPVDLKRKQQRADQGDELDVHSVFRGDLAHAWTRRRRVNHRSRMSVRLVAAIGGSRGMLQESMFWRGAAVARLAELLEEAGYRVEVVAYNWELVDAEGLLGHSVNAHTCEVFNSFTVKDAGAPIDLEQIAGVLCNAGFFRTYGFRGTYATGIKPYRKTQYDQETRIVNGRRKLMSVRHVLLARSYQRDGDALNKFALADDGTHTFEVPVGIDDREGAQKWVRKSLESLQEEVVQ